MSTQILNHILWKGCHHVLGAGFGGMLVHIIVAIVADGGKYIIDRLKARSRE